MFSRHLALGKFGGSSLSFVPSSIEEHRDSSSILSESQEDSMVQANVGVSELVRSRFMIFDRRYKRYWRFNGKHTSLCSRSNEWKWPMNEWVRTEEEWTKYLNKIQRKDIARFSYQLVRRLLFVPGLRKYEKNTSLWFPLTRLWSTIVVGVINANKTGKNGESCMCAG